jgi:hypothetical protein
MSVVSVLSDVPLVTLLLIIVPLVPLTELLYQIVSVQLLIMMITLMLIVNHAQLLVALVLPLPFALVVMKITIYITTLVSLHVQPDIGKMKQLTPVTLVIPTVKLVSEVPTIIVNLVKSHTSYKMEDVKLHVTMDIMKMKTKNVKHVFLDVILVKFQKITV